MKSLATLFKEDFGEEIHTETEFNYQIGKGWSDYFESIDEQNCPITSCSIKDEGCKNDYDKPDLYMDSNFQIYNKMNDP